MDALTVDAFQSLLMGVNLLLLAPIWWTLNRIYSKLDKHDDHITSLVKLTALIQGRIENTGK